MPTIHELAPPGRIRTRTQGIVQLHDLSIADATFAIARRASLPRDFAQLVIAHQLMGESLHPVQSWSDADLAHVGIMWLKHLGVPFWPPSSTAPMLELFQQGLCQGIRCQLDDVAATTLTVSAGAMQPIIQAIKG